MTIVPTWFRRVPMAVLAQDAAARGIGHDVSLAPATVQVPPLVAGAAFLARRPVREQPGGARWSERSYDSYSPWLFTFPDAIVHSSAGIVCVGDAVVEETLAHTDPARHAYLRDGDGIWIDTANTTPLPGVHISAAAGSELSYYHAMLDGVARLSVVPVGMLAGADGLIVPAEAPGPAAWLQERARDIWRLPLTRLPPQGSLRVQRLALADPNHGACNYHPCVPAWFAGMAKLVPPSPTSPRRFFIDRRQAGSRRLVEETEVIAALAQFGIEPVTLEFLSAEAQVALFRGAELVVAPHGAGLANLVFAPAGCRVLELQMDAYCHWCFRRLCAVMGLPYDCVVGQADRPWPDLAGPIHGARWHVSVQHVLAAVQQMLSQTPEEVRT